MTATKEQAFYSTNKFWATLCLAVTFIVMAPNMDNDWVNWDDDSFVIENPLVNQVSIDNIKETFSSIDENGGYTPLTTLSWSIDFSIDGYNPHTFHTTNVIIHLINVLLVFIFVRMLTGKRTMAVIVALMFGIHPMSLEAVAWVTSRKDLLYGMFYLAGLIAYLKFLDPESKSKRKLYLLCLLFFSGSLLSKGMAVTFPVTLLVIDYFKNRENIGSLIKEKTPFFAFSILFGVIAIIGQKAAGAVGDIPDVSFIESFFVACYGLVVYTFNAIAPVHLSSFHPYPYELGEALPWYLYASIIPVIIFIIIGIKAIKKNRALGFGILFFIVSIVLMLQFFPVGSAIVSERFSYVAYIGLFFVIALGISKLIENYSSNKEIIYGIFSIYLVALAVATHQRSDVWENGETLWTDVIEKYPNDSYAYFSRAEYYSANDQQRLALNDLNSGLKLNPNSFKALNNRGLILMNRGANDLALNDFKKALSMDPKFSLALINKGVILLNQGEYELALKDFNQAQKLDASNPLIYYNRALVYDKLKKHDEAIADFTKSIKTDESNYKFYEDRGISYTKIGNDALAKADFEKSLQLNDDAPTAQFELAIIYMIEGNLDQSLVHFTRASELSPEKADVFTNIGLIYLNQGKYDLAMSNLDRSLQLNPNSVDCLFNRGLTYHMMKDFENAVAELDKCIALNSNNADAYYWRSLTYSKIGKRNLAYSDAIKAKEMGYPIEASYLNSLR